MTSGQWANIGDDAGALHALVDQIRDHVAVTSIDYLWLFPPRKVAAGESIVMVIGAFDEQPDRRRVATAHFTVSRNRKGAATVNLHYDEHGAAPVAAVPRIVQGVLRRLGEDTEASPREEQIGGDRERWDALIIDLGGTPRPPLEPGDVTVAVPEASAEVQAESREQTVFVPDETEQIDPGGADTAGEAMQGTASDI